MSSHRRSRGARLRGPAVAVLGRLRQRIRMPRTRRGGVALLVLTAGLVGAAVIALVTIGSGAGHPSAAPPVPKPPASGPVTTPAATSGTASAPSAFRCAGAVRRSGTSTPQRICIPAIRVDTSVMSLGLNADRTVQVPPLSRVGEAGWYRYSAPPGAVGPTVILGHVDSARYGDGVFFRLARLVAGDTVMVRRGDGRTAVYRIDRVQEVPKTSFPTDEVYGGTSGPALRLVTCGGAFDSATGNYLDNIIAFGTLTTLTQAT